MTNFLIWAVVIDVFFNDNSRVLRSEMNFMTASMLKDFTSLKSIEKNLTPFFVPAFLTNGDI